MDELPKKACTLYAIHLKVRPPLRIAPPSCFAEAGKRTFFSSFVNLMGAVDAFNRSVSFGSWPEGAEPEIRDLVEGTVLYFRRYDGTWSTPVPEVHRADR